MTNEAECPEGAEGRTRTPPVSFPRRLGTLFSLYLVQGLPYGFFLSVLPLYLRRAGWSRTEIGFYGLLGLPWILKPLWAPLVDRFSWAPAGRRKSWILPCLSLLCVLTALLAAHRPVEGGSITVLLLLVFLVNLTAATEDVAVDGLAVDILDEEERGPGNAAQVVGFKAGMLCSGGLLLAFSATLGWSWICLAMAGLCALAVPVAAGYPEGRGGDRGSSQPTMGEILGSIRSLSSRPGFKLACLLIATYKMGETGVDAMYRIFLLDRGMDLPAIGTLCGTWGMVFSLAGSLVGGWMGREGDRVRMLFRVGIVRALPLVGIALLPFRTGEIGTWTVWSVTLAEHFAGGLLTPVMFAYMMDLCDRRFGATHYTALAAVEVVGKMGVAVVSGWVADRIGYGGLFSAGALVSVLWPVLAWKAGGAQGAAGPKGGEG